MSLRKELAERGQLGALGQALVWPGSCTRWVIGAKRPAPLLRTGLLQHRPHLRLLFGDHKAEPLQQL